MAEQVQARLEDKLPELQDLLKKEIFSKREVNEIVQQRTKFEYKLKRRGVEKESFLRYIEYEMNLEQVRKERIEKLGISKSRHSISDHSICSGVFSIYRRALRKFPGDVSLWFDYIRTLKRLGGRKLLGKALNSSLKLHPKCAELWIEAATWELEGNGNLTAMRALLQQGVRVLPNSQTLWLGYFLLEMETSKRIFERQRLLGIVDGDEVSIGEGMKVSPIALLVHRHALLNLPISAHGEFLKIALEFKVSSTDLNQQIREQIPRLTSLELVELARICASDEELTASIFENLSADSVEATRAIIDYLLELDDEQALSKADQVFQLAEEHKLLDANLYSMWVSLIADRERAIATADRGLSFFNNDPYLLLKRASLCPSEAAVFLKKITKLPDNFEISPLLGQFDLELLTILLSKASLPVIEQIFSFVATSNPQNLSKIWNQISFSKTCDHYLGYLVSLQTTGDSDAVRSILNKVLILYPTNANLWKFAVEFENKFGTFEKVSRIFSNAIKAIPSIETELIHLIK